MPSNQLLPSNGEFNFESPRIGRRGKTPLRFWLRVVMLASTVFALESAYTIEVSYAFPVLLRTGMSDQYASMMWAVSPLLGILFQGYLGSASDRSRCRWGKRRPFIVGLAVCVCVCLALFPYGENVSESILHLTVSKQTFVFLYTLVAFGLMDFSLDQVEPPVRMYLLDSVSVDQSDRANFIYSVMIAMGVGFGALIGAINWATLSVDPTLAALGEDERLVEVDNFDFQVRVVFGINLVLFAVCVLLTMCSFSERNPRDQDATVETDDAKLRLNSKMEFEGLVRIDFKVAQSPPPASTLESLKIAQNSEFSKLLKHDLPIVMNGTHPNLHLPTDTQLKDSNKNDHNIYRTHWHSHLFPKLRCLEVVNMFIHGLIKSMNGMVEFVRYTSVSTLTLWVVTWFGWLSYLAFSLLFSDYLAIAVYRGSPHSDDPSAVQNYTYGVRMACVLRAFVEIISIVYTVLLDWYSHLINYRWLVVCGNVIHVVAIGIMLLSPSLLTAFLVTLSAAILGSNQDCIPYMLIHYYNVSLVMYIIYYNGTLVLQEIWGILQIAQVSKFEHAQSK